MVSMVTASSSQGRWSRRASAVPAAVALVVALLAGCTTTTERDLTSALREYVGDSTTTSTSSPTATSSAAAARQTPASSTTTTTTTTTTTVAPEVGDGRTISRATARQTDRCLAGWYAMRTSVESTGELARDDFESSVQDCDRAIELLDRDRHGETDSVGPTAQLSLVLLVMRLQWLDPGMWFDDRCPPDSGTPCVLTADDLDGFGFLEITGPDTIVPEVFVGQPDRPLGVADIPGLRIG